MAQKKFNFVVIGKTSFGFGIKGIPDKELPEILKIGNPFTLKVKNVSKKFYIVQMTGRKHKGAKWITELPKSWPLSVIQAGLSHGVEKIYF